MILETFAFLPYEGGSLCIGFLGVILFSSVAIDVNGIVFLIEAVLKKYFVVPYDLYNSFYDTLAQVLSYQLLRTYF